MSRSDPTPLSRPLPRGEAVPWFRVHGTCRKLARLDCALLGQGIAGYRADFVTVCGCRPVTEPIKM